MRRLERQAGIVAALLLVIGMGFGRFAFTGLYPLMIADRQISIVGGSYAASSNYAGYLIGALLAALLSGVSSRKLCSFSVIVTIAALGLLGTAMPEWAIVVTRGFAGLASAVVMVAASHWLIHDRQHHDGAPALFAGVGIGILASAEVIAAARWGALSSRSVWLVLAITTLAIAVVAITMQNRLDRAKPHQTPSHMTETDRSVPFGATRLILVYGLAGFGYIITATYLPLLVRTALPLIDPVHIWAVFGLGAVPSCFLWHALHARWGTARSLAVNLTVQAVGVALPTLHVPAAYVLSALLVGGTFMGTVTIAMPAARRVAAKVRFNMLAIMTAAYGIGQIIGPLIAGALYERTQDFDLSLLIAGFALLTAAGLCVMPRVEGGLRQQQAV